MATKTAAKPAPAKTGPVPEDKPPALLAHVPVQEAAPVETQAVDVTTTPFGILYAAALDHDDKFEDKQDKETDVTFLKRLLKITGELSDAAWDGLGDAAQAWYNTSGEAIDAGKPLPVLEGYVYTASTRRMPAEKLAAAKKVKEPKAPKAKKEKAPKEPKEPKQGSVYQVFLAALESTSPATMTRADLAAALEAKKVVVSPATQSVALGAVQSVVRIAMTLGRFK